LIQNETTWNQDKDKDKDDSELKIESIDKARKPRGI
jgi:hypothetical protein